MPAVGKVVRPFFCYHFIAPMILLQVTVTSASTFVNPKVLGEMAWNMRHNGSSGYLCKTSSLELTHEDMKFFNKTKDWTQFSKIAFAY